LKETGRNEGARSWQVSYELFVGLKPEAPAGYVNDHIVLVTNDRKPKSNRLLVPVEGVVVPALSVKPSHLMLGLLKPGQQVTRTLFLRGRQPFRVVAISGPDDRFQFKCTDASQTLHLIPFTFTAADTPGKISGAIRIETDVAGSETLEVKFNGQVLAPAPEDSPTSSSTLRVSE
jgi:hypothetical protein